MCACTCVQLCEQFSCVAGFCTYFEVDDCVCVFCERQGANSVCERQGAMFESPIESIQRQEPKFVFLLVLQSLAETVLDHLYGDPVV